MTTKTGETETKMKTFKEFLDQCFIILENEQSPYRSRDGKIARSRSEAEQMGINYFLHPDGEWRVMKLTGGVRKVKKATSRKEQKLRRSKRGKTATSSDVNLKQTANKLTHINLNLNKEAHHTVPLERLEHMNDMTPEQRERFIRTMRLHGTYLGNDRRALMAVDRPTHERIHREYERLDRALAPKRSNP